MEENIVILDLVINFLNQIACSRFLKYRQEEIDAHLESLDHALERCPSSFQKYQDTHGKLFAKTKEIKALKYVVERELKELAGLQRSYEEVLERRVVDDKVMMKLRSQFDGSPFFYSDQSVVPNFRSVLHNRQETFETLSKKARLLDIKSTEFNDLSRQTYEFLSIKINQRTQSIMMLLTGVTVFLTIFTVWQSIQNDEIRAAPEAIQSHALEMGTSLSQRLSTKENPANSWWAVDLQELTEAMKRRAVEYFHSGGTVSNAEKSAINQDL